ncbi:hypothetical protein PUNSTDRAFT_66163 [Punctularia strigosozonata HHB-11173 SS5]|uniref:uncharacterized protein n=1 Tax=Punctularia strigosozonata (strain HHB-11173) TaxID=741275 RepID=UPI0004417335|nr:uncharacterized protein PUNSTDRAFT_66163 [Punctularia strigosozonata HHB-11173 SS5]EIN09863.1 hypothetical protein PUNSTDRAFT_66163 [Punctularia strigosozonata HHB-11173 SS5]
MNVKALENCVGGVCTPYSVAVPNVDKPRPLHQHQRALKLYAAAHYHNGQRHHTEKHQHRPVPFPPTISPIHRLPVELLARVFAIGVEGRQLDREIDPSEPEDAQPDFEVLVSKVCRHWRQVALGLPGLWCALVIRKVRHVDRAMAYIARSQKLPLEIVVDSPSTDTHVPGLTLCRDEVDDVFQAILPALDRWRSFTLKVRDSVARDRCRGHLAACGPAPRLEYLKLYHQENWPDAEAMYQALQQAPLSFGGGLPSCQHLSLVGVSLPSSTPAYCRGLRTLELRLHFEAFRPSYAQWEEILLASPGLEKLTLHWSGPKRANSDLYPFQTIQLSSLRELVLIDLDSDHLCYMLRHMRMPNLRVLRLDFPEQDVTPVVELATDPDAPMFASLETLAITSLSCSAPAWRRLLKSVANLITLELDLRRMDSRLMDEIMTGACKTEILALKEVPKQPLPSMLMPVLKYVRVKGITGKSLERLSYYRMKGGCEVQKWMLDSKSRDDDVERLRTNRGVNIEYFDASDDEQEEEDDEENSEEEEEADDDDDDDENENDDTPDDDQSSDD